MADPAPIHSNTGTSALASTTANFGFTATAGNVLVLIVGSDAYQSGTPTGYTLSTGMDQHTFLGHAVWWKSSDGTETSVSYTLSATAESTWMIIELSNMSGSPYDISAGQFEQASTSTVYTTPSVSTTAGRRIAIVTIGGARGDPGDWGSMGTWINGYTEVAQVFNNTAATNDLIGAAYLVFDGGGTTQGGATLSQTPDAETGLVIVFKAAAAAGSAPMFRGH